MSVRVRMAPSPTGYVHIGTVRTFLFNWLFARQQDGVCLLRIENTDTSREVEDAVEQIQSSLSWLGIDWDGPVSFQLDTADKARELAEQLVREDKAYMDEGAIRFRQPREGSVWWDDTVRGRIEFQNDQLADPVIVRGDGRPTYNFVSPVDDIADEITHVIRGQDHVSNTPTQINILRALGADLPVYAHVPDVLGNDGKKLSKRHGAVSVDVFRELGYLPDALVNFIALLGWSYDDKTTVMSRAELVERFTLERVVSSPATFDYEKLDWLNGMHLRALEPHEYAAALLVWLRERGIDWDEATVVATAPLVQEKIERFDQYPDFVRFLFEDVALPEGADPELCRAAAARLETLADWNAAAVEETLRAFAEELGQKPRQAFAPIRLAVTGSKVSPGLFESIEVLGRERTLQRLAAAVGQGSAAQDSAAQG
jgi:glutamyl-tRNA synthetase